MSPLSIIVCGAGTMGSGIAAVAARFGHETFLFDLEPAALSKAAQGIKASWQGLVDKGKMSAEEKAAAEKRLHLCSEVPAAGADLVIEAIVERLDAKIQLFQSLRASKDTIFASNTSSLSINSLQDALPEPGRVAGLHFFNPAPVMKLVEVVAGSKTDPAVVETLERLVRSWDKVPVVCKDAPGFIVNRVARPYYLEALRLAEAGVGDFATIDRLLESTGFKMGPFRLMDLIGNDINLAVTRSLYTALQHAPRFTPSPLQEALVSRGDLGRKTGQGYYAYV
ncbi:3-hydroxyacyl-CoA dehydrogenase NAD-binding domain-containing protein [Dinghuibacter silviterrae]|uniref:3-hydroxybutyryl-CoA dehydrogenase n=1 Tax=Dinghuibacter silviterrae TaxID=1539049 RepID=A0A4R8DPI1_9BACT|nr:3-hydroxyacyl-CoA dehydrogenase NAD-binding domain-containing protein [Dinghuibacter silviterrae]TDW99991.1 3-hydroxybutyryl-CoA dehydrogenase [Dinghuibacter silviterrae]